MPVPKNESDQRKEQFLKTKLHKMYFWFCLKIVKSLRSNAF